MKWVRGIKKSDLSKIKKRLKPFDVIQVDIKYLNDIPLVLSLL